MVAPKKFFEELKNKEIDFFTGVPDSLLKQFCGFITDNVSENNHVIAANEGAAIGLAMGYHLSTGKTPMVYMQNSGFGNTVNPLMSLVDPDVYSIPMIMLIGWRGEPGKKDEPQHIKQGKVMLDTLTAMGIEYVVIDGDDDNAVKAVQKATHVAKEKSCAFAIVVKKGTFEDYAMAPTAKTSFPFSREEAIKHIVDGLSQQDIVVATTGMASRELFEYREQLGQSHEKDFLTVGGMGHASQIALGIALQKPNRKVVCIDGDGAALMHLGSLAISGCSGLKNFKHFIINNGAHDSVGGQPTVGFKINMPEIAKSCGYNLVDRVENLEKIKNSVALTLSSDGPTFLEIYVNKGNRKDIGRPTTTPQENKQAFMSFLKG